MTIDRPDLVRPEAAADTVPVDLRGLSLPVTVLGGRLAAVPEQTEADLVVLRVASYAQVGPDAPVQLRWRWPIDRTVNFWRPHFAHHRGLPMAWEPIDVEVMHSAPVGALVLDNDGNDLVFALSANVASVRIQAGIEEETNDFVVVLTVTGRVVDSEKAASEKAASEKAASEKAASEKAADVAGSAGADDGTFLLRLDARRTHYAAALDDVARWWLDQLPATLPVPDAARAPTYCTWYADHQQVDADLVERRAEQARRLGCDVLIVDDGWQTADRARGYAYCGDWEPNPDAFPDMAAHVRRVGEAGTSYLMWYALPLLGRRSRAWDALRQWTLGVDERLDAAVLDPRFPQVRRYLVDRCLRAVRDWRVRGLKLDFLDSFVAFPAAPREGTDVASVSGAVEVLLAEIVGALRGARPDALIEFRQNYTGPRMWRYANLLRAVDCPLDRDENRARTLDLRLLCGDRAVHCDPLTWNPAASAEAVALQLVSVLFSVPQISVAVDRLPADHLDVLAFWLGVIRQYAAVLQHGTLRPSQPDLRYPVVTAADSERRVVAVYADAVAPLGDPRPTTLVANGGAREDVVVRADRDLTAELTVHDCRGAVRRRETVTVAAGVSTLPVPVGGLAVLELHQRT